jgi:hypothetical protein
MKVESRAFTGVGVFCLLMSVVYWVVTGRDGTVEPVGVVGMLLSAGLCGIIGGYLAFVARRIDMRPEDRLDGEIAEGAGDLGFFSPGSYWPLGVALTITVTAFGLAFFQIWLFLIGAVLLLLSVGGFLFEYYIGQNKPLRR